MGGIGYGVVTYRPSAATLLCMLLALVLVPQASTSARAATLPVPSGYPSIQSAINAAANGDVVLVSDGTYYERLDFLGKTITVESVNGAAVTVIDATGLGGVAVRIVASPGETPVLRGFTITGGYGDGIPDSTGGVYASGAVVENNIVTGNVGCRGGGIRAVGGLSLTRIRNNVVSHNHGLCSNAATNPFGGGILLNASAEVLGNLITQNGADAGGGISARRFLEGLVISGNVITDNEAIGGPGWGEGGGIALLSNALVSNNVIARNSAYAGGGVHWRVPFGQPSLAVFNNTLAYNTAVQGTAVFADGVDAQAQLTNNILIGAGNLWLVECGVDDLDPPIIGFNDVFNVDGYSAYGGLCVDQTGLNGNISGDPLFVDRATDDYHLQATSPAIDTGTNAGAPAVDIEGDARPLDGNLDGPAWADIGADEFVPAFPGQQTTSAVLHVLRNGDTLIFSSHVDNQPALACHFTTPLAIAGVNAGAFPLIAQIGDVQANGNLAADRNTTLNVLESHDSRFVVVNTICGSNTGDFGARAVLHLIDDLESGESVTLPTLYFGPGPQ